MADRLKHELHIRLQLGNLGVICCLIRPEFFNLCNQIRHRCRRPGNPEVLGFNLARARELLGLGGVVEQGQLGRLLAKDKPGCVALELDDPSPRIDTNGQQRENGLHEQEMVA